MGDTNSVIGAYKILYILRRLADWMETTFTDWVKETLLQMPNELSSENTKAKKRH